MIVMIIYFLKYLTCIQMNDFDLNHIYHLIISFIIFLLYCHPDHTSHRMMASFNAVTLASFVLPVAINSWATYPL